MSSLKKMYHSMQEDPFPQTMSLRLGETTLDFEKKVWRIQGQEKGLRYGENPDQPAALYELKKGELQVGGVPFRSQGQGLVSALASEDVLQSGKHPGKINLTDVDNGINILQYATARPAAVILKHNNPCGAAWNRNSLLEALKKAYASDRIAAFGGTIVVNRTLSFEGAQFINASYFEVVAAPGFDQAALDELKKRKNLRILKIPGLANLESLPAVPFLDLKSLVDGGIVAQFSFRNRILSSEDFLPARADKDGATFLARQPTQAETEDLLFAWAVEAGVTSNSVIFVKDGATVAIGTGEQDRVGCVDLTIHKAYTKYADRLAFSEHGLSLYELRTRARSDQQAQKDLEAVNARTQEDQGGLPGSVMVSDGFFPFRDGVDLAIDQGVTAVAQPGGAMNDHEVIQAVNQAAPQVAMVFTGQRSFKH